MTLTLTLILTREQIVLYNRYHSDANGLSAEDFELAGELFSREKRSAVVDALCTLAEQALAMQPRPIAEAPLDGSLVVVWASPKYDLPGFWSVAAYHKDAGWCVDELREATHFIPLSSLPEVEP